MDALRTAVTALNLEVGKLRIPRLGEGARAAPHVLVTARDMLAEERAKYVKAPTVLLRVVLMGVGARKVLSNAQILQVAGWRTRDEALEVKAARAEAVRLAQRITDLDTQVK